MADITPVATGCRIKSADTSLTRVQFGEAVTHGQSVYLKASDNKYWLANNTTSAETAGSGGFGIVMVPGSAADQYGYIAKTAGHKIDLGVTLTVGKLYCISNTNGGICPIDDCGSSERISILGSASTAAILDTIMQYTGNAAP